MREDGATILSRLRRLSVILYAPNVLPKNQSKFPIFEGSSTLW
jgi:hypothetical protein